MPDVILYGLHYSPWTERARWALDHHQVEYAYREHVPMLGEPVLRRVARVPRGQKASVPLLVVGRERLGDSFRIMRHADRIGAGESLGTERPEVARWNERLEPAIQAMRRRVTRRTLDDRAALTEAASAAVPRLIAPVFRPVAGAGARYLARKYAFEPADSTQEAEAILDALDALREAIGGGEHVEGRFSAADIIAATLLQGVSPVEVHVRMGPQARRMWRNDELAARYPDLLEWRDRIYERHRPRPERP